MEEPKRTTTKIRFGPYEADLTAGELRKGGIKVRLQPQPFRVLCLLLERSGEVVTREELKQELWPDDTFVEFDLSLNAVIKKIRRTLHDDPIHPRFIETLPRRGYRFVFPAERIEEEVKPAPAATPAALPAPAAESTPAPRSRPRGRQLVFAAALFVIGAVSLTAFLGSPTGRSWFQNAQRAEEQKAAFRFARDSQVSPNGRWLAYRDAETSHLGLLDLTTGEKKIVVEDWITTISWAPDNRHLAMVNLGPPPRGIEIYDIETGERRLLPHEPGRITVPWDWVSDTEVICTRRIPDEPEMREFILMSVEDGLVTPLRKVRDARLLRVSPDRRFVAYEKRTHNERTGYDDNDIYLAPLHGSGAEVVISDHPGGDISPFWSPDSEHVLFVRTTRPSNSLWSVGIDRATGEPRGEPELVGELGSMSHAVRPMATTTGDVYISRQTDGRFGARLLEVDPATGAPQGEPTAGFPENTSPQYWSQDKDGQWLGYISMNLGLSRETMTQTLVERNLATGAERIVTRPKAKVSGRPWHYAEPDDGAFAVYADRYATDIYRKNFRTGQTELLLRTEDPVSALTLFHDGTEMAFGTHSQGRDIHELRILNLASRAERRIGVSRHTPQWRASPDDQTLALGDLNCLVLIPRYGGKAEELACASPPRLPQPGEFRGQLIDYTWISDLTPGWSPDGSKIAWTVTEETQRRVELWVVDRYSGDKQVVWAGEEDFYTLPRGPKWSPDGRYIAFHIQQYRDHEVWVLRGLMP